MELIVDWLAYMLQYIVELLYIRKRMNDGGGIKWQTVEGEIRNGDAEGCSRTAEKPFRIGSV